jgi:serine/threonine-protein kinase RsbW
MRTDGPSAGDVVEVEVPADSAYVGVVRTLVAGVAARLDLDLDHVEDLRLAVSEAAALALGSTEGDEPRLRVSATVMPDGLSVTLTAPTTQMSPPPPSTFAWTVLEALTETAEADVSDGWLTVKLSVSGDLDAPVGDSAEAARP